MWMSERDTGDNRRGAPDPIAVGPALLLFVGLTTHILVLLFAAAVLAISVWKGSPATRWWGGVLLLIALVAGLALWQPLPVLNPGKARGALQIRYMSTLSRYSGTEQRQPSDSPILRRNVSAATGSPWVIKVSRGAAGKRASQPRISSASACAERLLMTSISARTGT